MQIILKVVKKVEMESRVVVTLEPEQTGREGDEMSGQLFIATAPVNATVNTGDVITIEIPDPVPPEGMV